MQFTWSSVTGLLVFAGLVSSLAPPTEFWWDDDLVIDHKTIVLPSGEQLIMTQTSLLNAVTSKQMYPFRVQTDTSISDPCIATGTIRCTNQTSSPPPKLSDCLVVGSKLENMTGTFVVEGYKGYALTYGTCLTSVINWASTNQTYCYQAWGAITIKAAIQCGPATINTWDTPSLPLQIQILNGS